MFRVLRCGALALACLSLTQLPLSAQGPREVKAAHLYRLDLRARTPDEAKFTADTRTVATDVYHDRDAKRLCYVADAGKALAVVPGGPGGDGNKPQPLHRLILPVRKWEEKEFGADTPKVGVEVYRDANNGNLVYVSHQGGLAVVAGATVAKRPAAKARWLERLPLKVREFRDHGFKPPLTCNVEVYSDDNTGCVIYVTEQGSLAVASLGKDGGGEKERAPVWSHGLDFKARAAGVEDFTAKTAIFGVEIYRDENRSAWVYISEKLRLAVTPAEKPVRGEKVKGPEWLGAVRDAKWSAEVFRNLNTDDVVYVTAAGTIAAVGQTDIPRRQALWKGLRRALADRERGIDVYAENDALTEVCFWDRGKVYLFSAATRKIREAARGVRPFPERVNRITFVRGEYVLWHDGEAVFTVASQEAR